MDSNEGQIDSSTLHLIRDAVRTKLDLDPSELDLELFILFVREGLPIARAQLSAAILISEVLRTAVSAFNPSYVVIAIDSCYPLSKINPLTGDPWEPGEAEEMRVHCGEDAKEWVQEALLVSIFDRNGKQSHFLDRYSITGGNLSAGGNRLWMENDLPALTAVGPHAYAAEIVSGPSCELNVRDPGNKFKANPTDPFYTAEKARVVIDIGATRILDEYLTLNGGGEMLFYAYSEMHANFLRSEGLGSWQIVHYPQRLKN